MRATLHLVAMPWSIPTSPSPQLAALEAYIESVLKDRIDTRSYSAFVDILLQGRGDGYVNYHAKCAEYGDYLYFLIDLRRFFPPSKRARLAPFARLVRSLSRAVDVDASVIRRTIDSLESRTRKFIDTIFVPNLEPSALNIVGLTLTFGQLYPSIYLARYLKEAHPDFRYLFLFGGDTLGVPKVAAVLREFEVSGIGVVGEGEWKLEQIVRRCLAAPSGAGDTLAAEITADVPGTFDIQSRSVDLVDFDPEMLGGQIERMEDLPPPLFDEYFAAVDRALPRPAARRSFGPEIDLVVEGSRGCCFGRCDFCDVNRSWVGHRTAGAEWVVKRALALVKKHRCPRVWFVDCSCDSWAGGYAEALIEGGIRMPGLMELRVHHPQLFWTKLSLAGIDKVQIGIEAVSPGLLRAINKGTTVAQNIRVQKWLKELGLQSCSNIITHHPKSTLEDVEVTKRTLSQIVHLDRLEVSPCALVIGSPLADSLSSEQRRHLTERHDCSWPKSVDRYLVSTAQYEVPKPWRNEPVMRAWDAFVAWEEEWFGRYHDDAVLSQSRCGVGELVVTDSRFETTEEHYLEGPRAAIYDLCHEGMTVEQLERATALGDSRIEIELSWLLSAGLILEVEGWFLSLAVRPRDELVRSYLAGKGATAGTRKMSRPCGK